MDISTGGDDRNQLGMEWVTPAGDISDWAQSDLSTSGFVVTGRDHLYGVLSVDGGAEMLWQKVV